MYQAPTKTLVFIDYTNMLNRFKEYGANPNQIDYIKVIKVYFQKKGYAIYGVKIYANFDDRELHDSFNQSHSQGQGADTYHTSYNDAVSQKLTVDALCSVFSNKSIETYILITSDRTFIPLIKGIQEQGNEVILVSSVKACNESIVNTSMKNLLLSDIFPLKNTDRITTEDITKTNDLVYFFLNSKIYAQCKLDGKPVDYDEYRKHAARGRRYLPEEVNRLYAIADTVLGLITLYDFERNGKTCKGIKPGPQSTEWGLSGWTKQQNIS
jgi:uncharacterized LabA/DUF88 family protein